MDTHRFLKKAAPYDNTPLAYKFYLLFSDPHPLKTEGSLAKFRELFPAPTENEQLGMLFSNGICTDRQIKVVYFSAKYKHVFDMFIENYHQ